MSYTMDCIPTLQGKRILITGGNSGLGFESLKKLATKDAELIIAVRSIERGNQAVEAVRTENKNANITVMELDLSKKESIENFATNFHNRYNTLDVLLNNAGIMTTPYGKTDFGIEQQQGVNHFGHFYLTYLLFDIIRKTPNSRIVSVSSLAHKYRASLNFNNLLYDNGKGYDKVKAYSRSKLENLMFIKELDRRIREKNLDIKAIAAHPGISKTNLGRHLQGSSTKWLIRRFQKFNSHPASDGCMPQVRACADQLACSGDFYGPDGFMQFTGAPVKVGSSRLSNNKLKAKQLWEISEKLMGIKFEI